MSFGFQTHEPKLSDPYEVDGLVTVSAGVPGGTSPTVHVLLSPDEARLYALKLLKAADQAEEMD